MSDIVGYSRLAGADEDRTLARLRGLRSDLIDPAITAHRGRIVKRTGDGSIIEFRSAVDAVRCAIELQSGLVERNAGLPPERRIEFRVGIHVGDVVEETDGDLMGDGVNIKAEDVKEIGKELGVRYVLEGSAQKSGARVRVDAQLIDAETGAHLWADQFDANQGELLEMQDEIVTRLARALQIQLAAVEASRVARAHPENVDAEELAMQCEAGYLRWGVTVNIAQPAFALCERALEMDARNIRALAILGVRSEARAAILLSDDPKAELRPGRRIHRARVWRSIRIITWLTTQERISWPINTRTKRSPKPSERSLSIRVFCRPISHCGRPVGRPDARRRRSIMRRPRFNSVRATPSSMYS